TTEGPWVFDAFRAKRVVKELRRRYLRDRTAVPTAEAHGDTHSIDTLEPFAENGEHGSRE
ncbi:MAG: hypothetical protein ACRDPT_05195, partial [Streptomycetales bacterium]